MLKYTSAALAAILLFSCARTMQVSQATVTDAAGNKMLLGRCSSKDLRQPPFNSWYTKNYDSYTVDETAAAQLKPHLAGKTFTLFMGTWCGDSKREVPRICRVLQHCGVKESSITLVMVNNSDSAYKQSPGHEERGLSIHRVPTLLVYSKGTEQGRIIESPVESWEKDLLALCSSAAYTPKYAGVQYLVQQFAARGTAAAEQDSTAVAAQLKQLLKSESEIAAYAKLLRTTGDHARGLLAVKLNAMAFPAGADARYLLAYYYQQLGNAAAAKENYSRVLALQPGHENARKRLEELEKQ